MAERPKDQPPKPPSGHGQQKLEKGSQTAPTNPFVSQGKHDADLTLPGINPPQRQHPWETCPALVGLGAQLAVDRNFMFIDARHHLEAAQWLKYEQGVNKSSERAIRLHEYYLHGMSRFGRFTVSAWENFNRAENYVTNAAGCGRILTSNFILEVNGLIQFGVVPESPTTLIRELPEVMGTKRDTRDFQRVFSPEGRYLSLLPQGPVEGFKDARYFFVRTDGTSVAEILKQLKSGENSPASAAQLLKELRARLTLDPHLISSRKSYIVFSFDRGAMGKHLNQVSEFHRRHTEKLIKAVVGLAPGDETGLRKLAYRIAELAVHTGSVIDIGHFAFDGMGRTNLRLERFTLLQWGITPPSSINVEYEGKDFENGTYIPKDARARLIVELSKLPVLDELRERAELLRHSLSTSIGGNIIMRKKGKNQ